MKQTFLKCLAIASFAFFANSAMADGGSVQSISDALQDRAALLAHKNVGLSQNVNSNDDSDRTAYLVVINYTNETIQATMPDTNRTLTFHTAAKYFESDHGDHKSYRIRIFSQSGNLIGDVTAYPRDDRGNVPINPRDGHAAHNLISVYGAYPNYTVYDTP